MVDGDSDITSDELFRDLCVELAAVAQRVSTRARELGVDISADEAIGLVLAAAKQDRELEARKKMKEQVVELAAARELRGLPTPITVPENPIEIRLTQQFGGERAAAVREIAARLHGGIDQAAIDRTIRAALEVGLNSLKRQAGLSEENG